MIGSARRDSPLTAQAPMAIPAAAAPLTASRARPAAPRAGPASASSPPATDPPNAIWLPRREIVGAAATASRMRSACARPGPQSRCAPHGTGCVSARTPMPQSAVRRAASPWC